MPSYFANPMIASQIGRAGVTQATAQPNLPAKPGMFGVSPEAWMMIAAALGKGAEANSFGDAFSGVGQALQYERGQNEEAQRTDAQQRATARMLAGDMKGAMSVLASAKGLEGDAFNMAAGLQDRENARAEDERRYGRDVAREDTIYGRTRADQAADDEKANARAGWTHIRDRTEQKQDMTFEANLRRELTKMEQSGRAPNFEKVTDKDGKVWWTVPGTNIKVDSGIEAPGAQSRSLLGAEAAARAYAGIPGAMEAINRMEVMEKGGKDAEGKDVAPYDPQADWGARAVQGAFSWIPGSKELGDFIGGDDFQAYTQGFSQFKAAMMPIMSGAAISPSEAEMQMSAVEPRMGDNRNTLTFKSSQRRRMVEALAAAAEGDRTLLNAYLKGEGGAASPPPAATNQPSAELPKDLTPQLARVLDPQDVAAWSTYTPAEKSYLANQVAAKMGMRR